MGFQFSALLLLMAPLIVSASLHMVFVRFKFLEKLAVPVSIQYFGSNKTWRGFLVMPVLTAFTTFLVTLGFKAIGKIPAFWPSSLFEVVTLGCLSGFFYVLFELPNSLMKRRLGIPAGKKSNKHTWFFVFIDQADSAFGCAILYLIFLPESAVYFLPLIVFGPLVHFAGNVFLYFMGLRKEAV